MALSRRHTGHVFKGEDFVVDRTFHLEDHTGTGAAPGYLLQYFIVQCQILLLYLDGFGDIAGYLFVRSQTLHFFFLLTQHHAQADKGVLRLRAKVKLRYEVLGSARQAAPVNCLFGLFDLDAHQDVLRAIILVLDEELSVF